MLYDSRAVWWMGRGQNKGRFFLAENTVLLWGCKGSGGVSAEGDNVTHCVEGVVAQERQKGLFLRYPDGDSGGQNVIYRLGEHCFYEVNVSDREHGKQHLVGCSHEGR